MFDENMIAMCGAYCGDCGWREKTNCKGCQASQGKMFWGECQVAKCAIGKGYTHCGLCNDVPCDTLKEYFNNPEHGDNGERLDNLKNWAKSEKSFIPLGTYKEKNSST